MGFIPADAAVRSSAGVRWALAVVPLAVLAADQVSKSLVLAADPAGPVGWSWVSVRLVRNSGAAGGLAAGHTPLVTLAALAVSAVAASFALRARSRGLAICLAVVLGGAAGNLADRLFRGAGLGRGAVVDWIHIGTGGGSMDISDLAIQFGVLGAVIAILVGDRVRGTGKDASVSEAPLSSGPGQGRCWPSPGPARPRCSCCGGTGRRRCTATVTG